MQEHKWYDIGFAKVRLERLIHDVHNSSIQLELKKRKKKVIYITDTKEVPEYIKAKGYDYYLIEANYKSKEEYEELIRQAQEKGEYTHLVRVLETHMCEEDAIKWLQENMDDNSRFEFIHQHKEESEVDNER